MELLDYGKTFLVGGGICLLGQILMDTTRLTAPRVLVIFGPAGGILTALGLYQPLVDWAGTGATVPLPGFGYSLVKGAEEAVREKGLLGAITGGMSATAAGVTVAIVFGYLVALISDPKSKR